MEIYVEYAFLENFLFDYVLLRLAFYAAKIKVKRKTLALSAACGGGFALLFPLLGTVGVIATVCKLSVGALLCMLPFHRLTTKQVWGKYVLTTMLFFAFSFGFGGSLLGVYSQFSLTGTPVVPAYAVMLGFVILTAFTLYFMKKVYQKRAIYARIFPCILRSGEVSVTADGFLDSGNLARKNGLPVCFLSPDVFHALFSSKIEQDRGQVFDEMSIRTLAGEKKVRLYLAEIEVNGERKQAYFATNSNMIGREYQILLNGSLIGEGYEMD